VTLEQTSRLRQGVYRLLGAGFAAPNDEVHDAAGEALDIFDALGLYEFAFALDVADAVTALAGSRPADLEAAHVALFATGVHGVLCSPHESTHLGNPRTGDVARIQSELRLAYQRYGLQIADGEPDMVDHAASELRAMSLLCGSEADLRAAGRPTADVVARQTEFAFSHMFRWMPSFANQVIAARADRVYSSLAKGLVSLLDHERQWLAVLNLSVEAGAS
jgi:TorA maturation chaperone TorD